MRREALSSLHHSVERWEGRDKENNAKFWNYFAGIIDGDGNFDFKGNTLKMIRIKMHSRDLRILNYLRDQLHMGVVKPVPNTSYVIYIVSAQADTKHIVSQLNGLIRIKRPGFEKACAFFDIEFKFPNYTIGPNDSYFAGLIDSDGSIVVNYSANRIECTYEIKDTEYARKFNFDNVIPGAKPFVLYRKKKNQSPDKTFQSISVKFQNVGDMLPVYNYFMLNRLYSDFKFFRVSKIKQFLEIKSYKTYPKNSAEYALYKEFMLYLIKHLNPNWQKII